MQNDTVASNFAKDLVKSVTFFDVLDDMRTMSVLGKNDTQKNGNFSVLGSESSSSSSSTEGNQEPTLQERLFGRKRKKKTLKLSDKDIVIDFQSRVSDEGVILFDGRTDEDKAEELSRDLF